MTKKNIDQWRYPIGEFQAPADISPANIQAWINEIELFPQRLLPLVANLPATELNWQYRPGGWSIRQVVHHCADSHMHSFIRFKLTLTENEPTIKPYFENLWAELPDTTTADITASLSILQGLHQRWVVLLRSLSQSELDKTFYHPENGQKYSLRLNIGLYAWHANHHLAHIRQALQHRGQFS